MRELTQRQIEVIRAVMLRGTISGAAEHLGVSAPGISRLVKHTEESLGVRLFERRAGLFIPAVEAGAVFDQIREVYAPFDDYAGMMEHIRANPGEVRFGSTGPGGLPSVVTAMIQAVEGDLDATFVPYDGDGPALTALQGGAIEVMPAVLGASIEGIRAGTMKPLAISDVAPAEALPDVPSVTTFNEGYGAYLPWGPFFGVFVKNGTPDEAVEKLTAAYAEAAQQPDFLELMQNRGFTLMNISGDEAQAFLDGCQQTTAWLMQDAGLTKASPEDFGIARPAQ